MIVTTCITAQRCADSFNKTTHSKRTYRVSDDDFDVLFTNAVMPMSRIHCLTLCTTNRTSTYYDSNTRRCRCQGLCVSYNPVSTGTNYIEKYYIPGTSACIHFNMSFLSSF